ncbi:putative B30.2/SPRY domain, concanavalin A-like lectin/glucanase domain superfamily [Helianthus annuus]|nr:putative B30.2/SPRY domain, concanavalin A-like lectin/glucanase domain superfamily [Helianthus annuus]
MVLLRGVKLTNELETDEWGKAEKVIGCGYNPSQKKVYFTVDSKLVREVYCTTEEFETPLYPILAANSNVTVLVNFGQSVFKYAQANLHRTPNPCFIGQSAGSPMIGSEDSRELFSMGRIDAHWLDRSTKRNAQYFGSVNRGTSDYDEFSEGDLFEIVLDSNSRGRSPSIHY